MTFTPDDIDAFATQAIAAMDALRKAIQHFDEFANDAEAHMLAVKLTRMSDETELWLMWRRKQQGETMK